MVQMLRDVSKIPSKTSIAIIEDDSSIQNLIVGSLLLRVDEVEAFQFKSAEGALNELWVKGTISPKIDVLFVDMVLEDQISGIDILEYCQSASKDTLVVLMSSQFTNDHLNKISNLKAPPILLKKPFSSEQIVQMTRWIFDLDERRLQ